MIRFLIFILLAIPLTAQNKSYGRQEQSGSVVDSTAAARTAPSKTGTSLPATCTVGDQYFKSDATAGQNIYGCTATNTWTAQAGSGGSGTAYWPINGSVGANVVAGGSRWWNPPYSNAASSYNSGLPIAIAGTATAFYVDTYTAQPSDAAMACTVLKNGTATALTITIAASSAAGKFSITGQSVSYAANDLIGLTCTNSSASVSASIATWSVAMHN